VLLPATGTGLPRRSLVIVIVMMLLLFLMMTMMIVLVPVTIIIGPVSALGFGDWVHPKRKSLAVMMMMIIIIIIVVVIIVGRVLATGMAAGGSSWEGRLVLV
jgi:hypothetical protein